MEEKKNLTAEEAFRLLLSRKATFQELDDDPRLLKACIVLLLDHVEKLRHRISDLNRATLGESRRDSSIPTRPFFSRIFRPP